MIQFYFSIFLCEIFFIKMLQNSGEKVHYSRIGDFQAQNYNFEIGGKGKQKKQSKENLKTKFHMFIYCKKTFV